MAKWSPRKKPFWDMLLLVLAVITAGAMMIAAYQPVDKRTTPTTVSGCCGVLIAIANYISKRIDERDKSDKAAQDRLTEEARQEEIRQLREKSGSQARRMIGAILEVFRSR